MDFDKFSKSRGIVIPHRFSVSKCLENVTSLNYFLLCKMADVKKFKMADVKNMCIREASATSWIINTKVSTLILFVEQTPGVGAQRERAATRGANKKIKERARRPRRCGAWRGLV